MHRIIVNIPALNEEKAIGSLLDKLAAVKIENAVLIPLVIDDGSTDRTVEIAKGKGANIISHGSNIGAGAAFRTGVKEAIRKEADILVNIDGDGQFDPKYIPELIKPILEGEADFVTVSRFLSGEYPEMPGIKIWGNKKIARLLSALSKRKITDASCGFRAYSGKTFMSLNLIGNFTYTHETLLLLIFKGFNLKEISVPVRGVREFGDSRLASNLFRYALRSLLIIIRCYRDYKPIQTLGLPGLALVLTGFLLLAVFFVWTYLRGEWYPKIAAFAAAFSILSGLVLIVITLIADMVTRMRVQLDSIIDLMSYKERMNKHTENKDK